MLNRIKSIFTAETKASPTAEALGSSILAEPMIETQARSDGSLDQRALLEEQAGPTISVASAGMTGVRRVVDVFSAGGMTPSRLAGLIAAAQDLSDTKSYFQLAEIIEERDAQYRSVLGTRKLAVTGLDLVVEAASDSPRDEAIADLVRGVLYSDPVQESLIDLMDALNKGISVSEIMWDTSASVWTPSEIIHRPAHYFDFDKADGRTLVLRPETLLGEGIEMTRGKYIIHSPKLKSGLPVRSGLAMVASWAWLIKSIAAKDWLAFVEIFGQPIRVGKYAPGTPAADIAILKKAVASLGTDAAAVLPETMKVEFIEAAQRGSSADLYERLCGYFDSQISKLVLGQTLTTDSGGGSGSFALGKVHGDVRSDILRADAKALAMTLTRDLVKPLVELNFGAAKIPTVRFQIEEPEDLVGLSTILAALVPMGLQVEQSVIRDKLGLPEPAPGAALLGPVAAAPVPGAPAKADEADTDEAEDEVATQARARAALVTGVDASSCPMHGDMHTARTQRDVLDDEVDSLYADFDQLADPVRRGLLEAVDGATSLEEMKDALQRVLMTVDVSDLTSAIASARTKARLAGESGTDI